MLHSQRMNGGGVQGKDNCVFVIADAGGHNAQPETGDREYFIIAGNSGCYLTYNGTCLQYRDTELY